MADTCSDADDRVLKLPALLDLIAASPLHRALLERIGSENPLVVAAASVERVSTAAVQILLAAAAEARSRGHSFQLRDPSPVLAAALADLGVAPFFDF